MGRVGGLLAGGLVLAGAAIAQPGGAMPVLVVPAVEKEMPASVRLVGSVLPQRRAIVASEVAGIVAEFTAEEGRRLKAGEPICRLDSQPAKLRLEEAEALLGSFQARLDEIEAGTRSEILSRQKALVEEAQAMRDKWEFEHRRMKDLTQRGVGNEKEQVDAEMQYLAAERRLSQARSDLEMAENGARKEERARARLDVAAQRAVAERLKRDLSKTEIRAPFDAFVVAKRTEVGEWLAEGGAVCELVAIETVKVRCDAPEAAIPFAQPGATTTIEVEALGRTLGATVARVIPSAAQSARTFPVEADLPNPEHALLPGMFVWMNVPAGPPGRRLMVHKDAIVARGPAKTIFVVRPGPDGSHMATPLSVTTGLEAGNEVAVEAAGLKPGDLVVVRANERLYGPTPVLPTPMGGASQPAEASREAAAAK